MTSLTYRSLTDNLRCCIEKGQQSLFDYRTSELTLEISDSFFRVVPQLLSSSDSMSQIQPVHLGQFSDTTDSSLPAKRSLGSQ